MPGGPRRASIALDVIDESTPADGAALPQRLDPALLDDHGLEGEAMRASVRQRLFGGPPVAFHIDRFVVTTRLGTGGMGVVYLAEDPILGRKVAIKLLRAEGARSATAQARLQREARALASLSHPNVVVVYEVGMHEGQLYLVMEHVAGQTLREWTRAHAKDWRAIVAQYRAAGEGLAAAHRAGIIHRDFKPDNVLVDEDGRSRVLDFGLAASGAEPGSGGEVEVSWQELDGADLTKTGTILGTPSYMAPEQFLGLPVDARSDQFSFCVALWRALFEQRPFEGNSLVELRRAVIAGRRRQPPARTRVPRSIIAALARGLSPDPAHRFPAMPELLQALAEPLPSGRRAWFSVGVTVGLLSLGGLAAARWLARASAPVDPPPSSASTSPATAAVDEPATVEALAELPSRRLTHTTGFGVWFASVSPSQRGAVYVTPSSEQVWFLPLSPAGAEPRALPLRGSEWVHVDPDGAYWSVGVDAIRRIQPDGTTDRIIERAAHGTPGRSRMSPDGTSIAIDHDTSALELWDLRGTTTEPVRISTGSGLWGVAWSPDASQLAAIVRAGPSSHRLDVFDASGTLQSSTPWPDMMAGWVQRGLVWLPSGFVALVSDPHETWVQCLTLTEEGLTAGRRSAGMSVGPLVELIGASDRTLVVAWPDEEQQQVIVLERSEAGAWQGGPLLDLHPGRSNPVWRSETDLAFLAAEPPGALLETSVDEPTRQELLAPGPFDWASGDGNGGVVLGSSESGAIDHLAQGATELRRLRLPNIGSSRPVVRCRSPRDCLMSSGAPGELAFFGLDLERQHVRRRFACPAGTQCGSPRWGRARDELLLVGQEETTLLSVDAESGEPLEEQPPRPSWFVVQAVTETPTGERLVTGIREGEPPEAVAGEIAERRYLLLQLDDGEYRPLWGQDHTWLMRPRPSPSGQRLVLEGLAFHIELVALELGSLCDEPP